MVLKPYPLTVQIYTVPLKFFHSSLHFPQYNKIICPVPLLKLTYFFQSDIFFKRGRQRGTAFYWKMSNIKKMYVINCCCKVYSVNIFLLLWGQGNTSDFGEVC